MSARHRRRRDGLRTALAWVLSLGLIAALLGLVALPGGLELPDPLDRFLYPPISQEDP